MNFFKGDSNILTVEQDPIVAVKKADLIVTDKWVSMHDDELGKSDLNKLENFRVTRQLLDFAKQEVLFMHCLPADKGQEVSKNILKTRDVLLCKRHKTGCICKNLFSDGV